MQKHVMLFRLRKYAIALSAAILLTVVLAHGSHPAWAIGSSYDEPKCRSYADDGDHERAAECYYSYADARYRSSAATRYDDAFELLGFAIVEARLAGDKYVEAKAFAFQANIEGLRLDKPDSATQRAEDAALLFLQVDPDTEFDDDGHFLRLIRLRTEVAYTYNNAGQYAEQNGDLERAVEMYLTGGRLIARAHQPAQQAAAELITVGANGKRQELGNAGLHNVNFKAAVEAADKMQDSAAVIDTLIELLVFNRDFIEAGFERSGYLPDTSSVVSAMKRATTSDLSLLRRMSDRFDADYEYAMSGAPGATETGEWQLHEGLVTGYAQLAGIADSTHGESLLASHMYEKVVDLLVNNYRLDGIGRQDQNLKRAAEYVEWEAQAARKAGDLQLAEDMWIRGAELFERYIDESSIDRIKITLSYAKLDAVYYGQAGTDAQNQGDCSRADAWFRKQAEALGLYDGKTHEPRVCNPPANLPTPTPSSAQPEPTASTTQRPNPDAALDDLINTFGRMTREVAEERIKVEIKTNLGDMAAWLGQQMQDYLTFSPDFYDAVYDSLPDFSWEELAAAGTIPSDVQEQPDDPSGPGLSFEDLINLMTKKVPIPSNLDAESGEELYNLVTAMLWAEDPESGRFIRTRASGGEVIELKRQNGTTVRAGVFVTPDGRVMYSTDGSNYYSNLEDAIDPSYPTQGIEWYRSVTGYVWQRGLEGRSLDSELQLMNDVSTEVLDEFRREMSSASASSAPEDVYDELKDPFKDVKGIGGDPYQALEGKATKSAHDYLEGQLWDPIKDKLKGKRDEWLWAAAEKALDSSIEFEARQNFKFLLKEYQDLGTDALAAWEDMKKKAGLDLFELTGISKTAAASGEFMVSAIQQMGKGLQDSDFGVRARVYIKERQQGMSPEQLWQQTRDGEIAELEISQGRVTRSGIESTMAQQGIPQEVHLGLSFSLYEQAYQRFLLAQQLGRK